ncbi:MAG TPA: hypothetical protein VJY62_16900 [Bacteroidia bacterium]|nr:hypothetical protein [Bacteroidia bacterium]
MKNFKIIFVLFSLLFLSLQSFSQAKKFKCDVSQYADEHTSDQQWNDLIDNACKEINKGNYKDGYTLLSDAMTYDSLHSENGVYHEYIGVQLRKLKQYMDSNQEEANSEKIGDDKISEEMTKDEKPENRVKEEPAKINETEKEKVEEVPVESPAAEDKIETPAKAEPESPPVIETSQPIDEGDKGEKTFSDFEMKDLQEKGMQKIHSLEDFMLIIANKRTSSSKADDAIENAMQLFDSEYHFVETSSVKSGNKTKSKTRKYLEKLKLLNYDNIDVEWAEFQYTSDFVKGPDNNYHGYIKFVQRFTGWKDNVPVYSDKTTKTAEVILKAYTKGVEGVEENQWDVFLGDISVLYTEKF